MKKISSRIFSLMDWVMCAAGLNLLFLLCCLPLVTAGAALTALYSGWRALIKKEACFRAFFHCLRTGFLRATAAWLILCPPSALLLFHTVSIAYYQVEGYLPFLIFNGLFSLLLVSITTMLFLFYSRFECTLFQLLRHAGTLTLSHPLRAALIAVLTWAPAAWVFIHPMSFFALGMLWLFFYYSFVAFASVWIMNKPFARFAARVSGIDKPQNNTTTKEESPHDH